MGSEEATTAGTETFRIRCRALASAMALSLLNAVRWAECSARTGKLSCYLPLQQPPNLVNLAAPELSRLRLS
jgi:hypothetical protein